MNARAFRHALRALYATLLAAAACVTLAQTEGLGLTRESAVKAAFLYKFGSFVEWPASAFKGPQSPFVIGVYGDDAVASDLEQIAAGREVNGHPVKVERIRDADDVGRVHVLFAGGPRESRVREVLAAVRGPVLTVSDGLVGGRPGPVLFFVQEDGRIRFGASLTAAAARGIQLSAKLLAVAQQVEGR